MERPVDQEWPAGDWKSRPTVRTQRTKLQSALLAHVPPGVIRLSKKLETVVDLGGKGVDLHFADGTRETADLVVGADGIRSVCRHSRPSFFMCTHETNPPLLTDTKDNRSSETAHGQTTRSPSRGRPSGAPFYH